MLEDNILECFACDQEHTHLVTTLQVSDDDHYRTTKITVDNQYEINARAPYRFRSQGNIHLLFMCESGHYFIKSFDGHKGNMLVDENPLMEDLSRYLNEKTADNEELDFSVSFQLLGYIESFLKALESSEQ